MDPTPGQQDPLAPRMEVVSDAAAEAAQYLADWDQGGFDIFQKLERGDELELTDKSVVNIDEVNSADGRLRFSRGDLQIVVDRGLDVEAKEVTMEASIAGAFSAKLVITVPPESDGEIGLNISTSLTQGKFLEANEGLKTFRTVLATLSEIGKN